MFDAILGHTHDGVDGNGPKIDGSNVVNTPNGNIIATTVQSAINELDTEKIALDGWIPFTSSLTYASATTVTIASDITTLIQKGYGLKYQQTQAYTNDPVAGSNIVLNMVNTHGSVVGSTIIVSSSAGTETTTVVSTVNNTSITVALLTLDHTTTNPLVTFQKYAYIVANPTYSAPNSTLTINAGSDFTLVNETILNAYWTPNPQAAFGFPYTFTYANGKFKLNGNSLHCYGVASATITNVNNGSANIVFPLAYADTTYNVTADLVNVVEGAIWVLYRQTGKTTSGITIGGADKADTNRTGTLSIAWSAVGNI